jgi:DNA transformation protein
MLEQADIRTVAQLQKLGAVRAYLQVKRNSGNASLNLLWAMEGALTGRHWLDVAKHDRLRLLLELEDLEKTTTP